ncbi:hypothetical protein DICA4_C01200 [Diutina catenulata]
MPAPPAPASARPRSDDPDRSQTTPLRGPPSSSIGIPSSANITRRRTMVTTPLPTTQEPSSHSTTRYSRPTTTPRAAPVSDHALAGSHTVAGRRSSFDKHEPWDRADSSPIKRGTHTARPLQHASAPTYASLSRALPRHPEPDRRDDDPPRKYAKTHPPSSEPGLKTVVSRVALAHDYDTPPRWTEPDARSPPTDQANRIENPADTDVTSPLKLKTGVRGDHRIQSEFSEVYDTDGAPRQRSSDRFSAVDPYPPRRSSHTDDLQAAIDEPTQHFTPALRYAPDELAAIRASYEQLAHGLEAELAAVRDELAKRDADVQQARQEARERHDQCRAAQHEARELRTEKEVAAVTQRRHEAELASLFKKVKVAELQAQAAAKRVSQAEDDAEKSQKEAETSRKEAEASRKEAEDARSTARGLERQVREVEDRFGGVKNELERTQAELESTRAELEKSRAELNATSAELKETQAELAQADSRHADETRALENELVSTRNDLANARTDLASAVQHRDHAASQLEEAQTKLALAHEQQEILQDEYDNARKTHLAQEEELMQRHATLDDERQQLVAKIAHLTHDNGEYRDQMHKVEEELANLDRMVHQAREENDRLKTELRSSQRDADSLRAELDTTKAAHDAIHDELAAVHQQCDAERTKATAAQHEYDTAQREWSADRDGWSQEVSQYLRELDDARAQLKRAQRDYERAQQTSTHLETEVASYKSEVAAYKTEVAALHAEVDALNQRLADKNAAIAEDERKLSGLLDTIETSKNLNARYEREVAALQHDLDAKVDDYEAQLRTLQDEWSQRYDELDREQEKRLSDLSSYLHVEYTKKYNEKVAKARRQHEDEVRNVVREKDILAVKLARATEDLEKWKEIA